VECYRQGKRVALGVNLYHYHILRDKYHLDWPGIDKVQNVLMEEFVV